MNLTTQHLPSHRFIHERAHTEQRLGCRLVKFFCDEPPPAAPSRTEINRLIATSERLVLETAALRLQVRKQFGVEVE